ncbi:type IV toxin-antitoxin system AbiEi family antitoxin domain-containing protein [Pseudomonas aeruginosa]|uniref:type IV toxin-antitoxin system AbiEi family antitoxin domain-containing protein n=1 Tax=Pseudomonas aeruginosa TaxID=287 RepID=UPI000689585D|nr:type IV toxin-antitoxin system AbiEi family antitoxin domain-containing protein [Pseudomonas aeruginosa]EKX2113000.1 type IV toxin-antitoxin system AbiEi family antitoxin domain-containing protein [Pseudomonas aeruginosa]EKY4187235.1 type IV toxin-antitoxin system AbiEi family antitoxin domain-containing protein [Pseudomonas aeruginosa]ELL1259027.1 type IV toxin-antitoxin system AbiEi family antitoxin domain-containing protein [Pseudomonas aeruginosa]ELT3988959.1 type IV toxin-antitoxin syst
MSAKDLTTLEVTDAQLAALAGVSTRRIRQLVEAGRLTRVSRNRYALGDAFAALVEDMAGGDKASELTAERVRKLRAEATLAELQLAKEKGEVAPLSECQKAWEQFCVVLRTNLLLIPTRVAQTIVGETDERRLKAVLREEIILALHAAADYNPEKELSENE